jgi:hypothetical protein
MERTYYPSIPKAILFNLALFLAPEIGYLLGYGIRALIDFAQGSSPMSFDWVILWVLLAFCVIGAGLRIWSDGLRGERLAIKLTETSIAGPVVVGRAEPIQFDEIDYQKTFKANSFLSRLRGKRVYSLDGDQITINEVLFEPEQVAKIWAALEQARQQRASYSGRKLGN